VLPKTKIMKLYIKKTRYFTNALCALILLFFTACSNEEAEEIPQPEASINLVLNETELNLNVGDTFQLSATGNSGNETIQWSSSDTSIATVENGVVTTFKGGDALITAQVGTVKTTCTVNVAPDVFLVGLHTTGAGKAVSTFKYWKNQMEYTLEGYGADIFVEGNNVYIAGAIRINGIWIACYWKNGERFDLTDGTSDAVAMSIFVKDDNVYAAGTMEVNQKELATVWKNGEARLLFDNFTSIAKSIVLEGNDVYVLVTLEEIGVSRAAVYFKNDEIVHLGSSTAFSDAEDIFVMNGDVHVVGWEVNDSNDSYDVAKYWKNGQEIALVDENEHSKALSVFIEKNQVHIVGVSGGVATDNVHATYWRNGEEIQLQNNTSSFASKIIIIDGIANIIGGYAPDSNTYGRYWVDGELMDLPQNIGIIKSLFIR